MPTLQHLSPAAKFFFLIILIISGMFLTLMLGMLLAMPFLGGQVESLIQATGTPTPASLPLMKYLQIVSQIGFFIVPVIAYARMVEGPATTYLLLHKRPPFLSLLIALALFVVSVPAINHLLSLNTLVDLPAAFDELEAKLRETEKRAEALTLAFLGTSTWTGLAINLLMIAILPAIGEEFLFRGTLTRIFFEWSRNKHLAIFISSLLFSALHMQFFGFLPRLALGFLLGYLFVWTGNLWIPIAAHFINNVIIVVAAFFAARGWASLDITTFGSTENAWLIAGSFVLSLVLLWILWIRHRPSPVSPKQETGPSPEE